jgi:plasmid maintenance system antidote protein VapI
LLQTALNEAPPPDGTSDIQEHGTLETAVWLEAVISPSAETWLALQSEYDLWRAQRTIGIGDPNTLASA